ncbi:hypothetical protein BDR07DRAFT_1418609 [Suillus spraguei]|nr:hypothetical protein BDR07DRAFT_1431294 [Suillus spraguei]KAG2358036.1 hypothetical protein BDR07DRAFT_1418609 [Suillus spraguei]
MQIIWPHPILVMYKSQRTRFRQHHQVSVMTLITVIISATAMVGVVLATSVPNLHCPPGSLGCGSGPTYNNGNDFIYKCGEDGFMNTWFPCSCNDCCYFDHVGYDFIPVC